jgi:hypothetical protein
MGEYQDYEFLALGRPLTTEQRAPARARRPVTLRAALPHLTALTAAERALLGDWLDRIAEGTCGR